MYISNTYCYSYLSSSVSTGYYGNLGLRSDAGISLDGLECSFSASSILIHWSLANRLRKSSMTTLPSSEQLNNSCTDLDESGELHQAMQQAMERLRNDLATEQTVAEAAWVLSVAASTAFVFSSCTFTVYVCSSWSKSNAWSGFHGEKHNEVRLSKMKRKLIP